MLWVGQGLICDVPHDEDQEGVHYNLLSQELAHCLRGTKIDVFRLIITVSK